MLIRYYIHNFLQATVEFTFQCVYYIFYLLTPILKPIFKVAFGTNGIEINGNNAWDMKITDDRFYPLVAAKGLTGYLTAFIEGYIKCDDLETAYAKLTRRDYTFHFERYHPYRLLKYFIHAYVDILTPECIGSVSGHYEDESIWQKDFSDQSIQYSTFLLYDEKQIDAADPQQVCEILDEAGIRTKENVARKLRLEPGMKVLDIGCGYGGLAKHLAERYKVEVTGVTLSSVMAKTARNVCKGLPVEIINDDYRAVTGKFDRIVSIEMFEHVGQNHHREYFEKVDSLLVDDGVFFFQAYHCNRDCIPSYSPLFEKCIQCYCYFPRLEETVAASKGLFILEDMLNIGYCIGVSTKACFKKAMSRKEKLLQRISEKEWRMLYMYTALAEASGFSGYAGLYQMIFSKDGLHYARHH